MKVRISFISATIILLAIFIGISTTSRYASASGGKWKNHDRANKSKCDISDNTYSLNQERTQFLIENSGQLCVMEGAEVESANLTICVYGPSGEDVTLYRILSDWSELGVTWNSFAASYDGVTEWGSFAANSGCQSVDVKSLVQAWIDGAYENHGFLLKQGLSQLTWYRSSEYETVADRPKLEICFVGDDCMTIQRPGIEQDGVADTYIWEITPDVNRGSRPSLNTGELQAGEKQSLIRFGIEVCPPGTGTPGYWKNHAEAWPIDSITVGCETYTKAEAIEEMKTKVRGDKTRNMFNHLVSAILNVMIGNPDECIADRITEADAWLCANPLGTHVSGDSAAWDIGEPLKNMLDSYNNGKECAPHRD